jgi:WD40 repeat protein
MMRKPLLLSLMWMLLWIVPVWAQDANAPQDALPQAYTEVATLGYGQLSGASWRPDGNAVVVNSTHGATIYNLDFKRLHHFEKARQATFSLDGQFLGATIRDPYQIVIWETDTYKQIKALDLSFEPPPLEAFGSGLTMDWSPDGLHIAVSGMNTNIVEVFEVASEQVVMSLDIGSRISHLSWRPDGQRLAVSLYTSVLMVDPQNGEIEDQIMVDIGIRMALWSPDQETLAIVSLNTWGYNDDKNDVQLWDVKTDTLRLVIQAPYTHTFAWSPDSQTIATGEWTMWSVESFTILFWDAQTGKQIAVLPRPSLRPRIDYQKLFALSTWSPDGTHFMTVSEDNVVRIHEWPFNYEAPVRELLGYQGSLTAIAWNGEGTQIIASSEDSGLHIWDVETGEPVTRLQAPQQEVDDVAWNSVNNEIAFITKQDLVYAWSLVNEDPSDPSLVTSAYNSTWEADVPPIVAYSPDGQYLASAGTISNSAGGSIMLSSGPFYNDEIKISTPERAAWSLSWSGDSTRLAYTADSAAALYTVEDQTTSLFSCEESSSTLINAVALSPDGRILAASSDNRDVCLWNTETGELLPTLITDNFRLGGVSKIGLAWNPDSERLASIENYGQISRIIVWDIPARTVLAVMEVPGFVSDIAWSLDGTRLAASDTDGLIHIWQP